MIIINPFVKKIFPATSCFKYTLEKTRRRSKNGKSRNRQAKFKDSKGNNQKPYFEEGQIIQWPTEKKNKINNGGQNIKQKTIDLATLF